MSEDDDILRASGVSQQVVERWRQHKSTQPDAKLSEWLMQQARAAQDAGVFTWDHGDLQAFFTEDMWKQITTAYERDQPYDLLGTYALEWLYHRCRRLSPEVYALFSDRSLLNRWTVLRLPARQKK